MSWVAAAVGVGTLAYGIYQDQEGKKQQSKAEGKMMAEAQKENKAQAERMDRLRSAAAMGTEMPGQTRREDIIDATTARRIEASQEAATSSAAQQNMVAQAVLDQQSAHADLGAEAAQHKQDREDALTAGLGEQAGMEEAKRDRMMDIYEGQLAEGVAQEGAGKQNIMGGATTVAGSVGGQITGGGSSERLTTGQKQGRQAEAEYARMQSGDKDFGGSDKRRAERDARRRARTNKKFQSKVDEDFSPGGAFYGR